MGTYIGRVVNDYMELLPVQLVRVSLQFGMRRG